MSDRLALTTSSTLITQRLALSWHDQDGIRSKVYETAGETVIEDDVGGRRGGKDEVRYYTRGCINRLQKNASVLPKQLRGVNGAYGSRTRVTGVRGQRPRPLDECAVVSHIDN